MNQVVDIVFPKGISLVIKREDLLHPLISGNKFRKLKYNIEEAKKQGQEVLVSFGGAFSNHILALAAAGNEYGFKTIGVIRGNELESAVEQNPTLFQARKLGMKFLFVTREEYRTKTNAEFLKKLQNRFGDFYVVPEGGTNELAVKGCEEILNEGDSQFDYVCTAVGTGGTISGIINSSFSNQKILGFSALKGDFLSDDIRKFARKNNWELIQDYNFGGYAKVNEELISFLNELYQKTAIPLDPVYTGKMVYGIIDLIEKGYFPENAKILAIHTGGLQGIRGINLVQQKKNRQTLVYDF
ncbi:pyridoxal-phosphate dependent enzyme [Flavobacterium sp. NRK F10]|uniref:1-aminocyclopropane-1-carboxylate deaminase n=1 Tax=Flavobacterium sediminis TaxID=2201181 RepID=A0A2U8QWU7_9FLAO|nr:MULTISPECIES: pyridoxal-phosphate dependent enzyme [Flavobacterium]AWM14265.1 1-aminocyclopropane-1-carboxylate deaminase [Flavobacterium sediminis]MCO6175465.1 pyridoxal-phosphate dependent enzyme [Flavobacterium sp. NRK F10]